MLPAGQRIRNQRGQEAVDRTQEGENERRLECVQQKSRRRQFKLQGWQPGRDRANDLRIREPQNAKPRPDSKRHKCPGRELRQPLRPKKPDRDRGHADDKRADVNVAERRWKRANGADCATFDARGAKQGQQLHQHDDHADSGHEPGNDHTRRIGDKSADPGDAQQHLQQSGQNHDRQGFGESACMARQNDRHCDGHRCCRPRDLRFRAAEDSRKETNRDGPVESGRCTHPRGNSESKRHRKRHDHRGDATKDITAQCVEVVLDHVALRRAEMPRDGTRKPVIPNSALSSPDQPDSYAELSWNPGRLSICKTGFPPHQVAAVAIGGCHPSIRNSDRHPGSVLQPFVGRKSNAVGRRAPIIKRLHDFNTNRNASADFGPNRGRLFGSWLEP